MPEELYFLATVRIVSVGDYGWNFTLWKIPQQLPQSKSNVVGRQPETNAERLIEALDDLAVLCQRNRMCPVAAKAKHRACQLPVAIVSSNDTKWPATGSLIDQSAHFCEVRRHRLDMKVAGRWYPKEVNQVHASSFERLQRQA